MALGPDEHLELECGEDIDLVGRAIGDNSEDGFKRKLEQIKLRATKLSLRSESALEVLANAVGHLLENSSLRLRFCYTTNAVATRERHCPFPNKASGIELWNQLSSGSLTGEQLALGIQSLRQFLVAAAKPKKVSAATWAKFVEFVRSSSESQLVSFIRTFEWCCGGPEVAELADRVRDELQKRGNDSKERLDEAYDRVFLYVFRLLTQPSLKRLTRTCFEEQLTAPALADADRLVLNRLQSRFDILEERVGEVEQSVDGVSESVTHLVVQHRMFAREIEKALEQQTEDIQHATTEFKDEVTRLAIQQGIHTASIDSVGFVTIISPPIVEALSPRSKTVADLLSDAADKVWLAIYGVSDTGKTHLAALVARAKGQCRGWLRFHYSMTEAQALLTLREALRRIGDFAGSERLESSTCYELICDQLEPGSCLVLDDVPNLVGAPVLTQQLHLLEGACRARNVLLVSSSHFQLPSNLAVVLGPRLFEIPVPRFSDLEAQEVLVSHGAPDAFASDETVRFINGLSSGHPLLLTLAAKFLKERDWRLNDAELTSLMRGDHSIQVADEVLQRISRSLDTQQRELLYRMTLAVGTVTDADAMRLAAVEVAIERPKERLVGLVGAWAQRDTDQKLAVSPLVRNLGKDNLAPKTLVGCHAVLGEIITNRTMSPWDAEMAVLHFLQAREFDRAGVLWLTLLGEFQTRKVVPELRSVLALWYRVPLPIEMSLDLRVTIRAMQFRVLPRYEMSLEPVLCDLDRLMGQLGPSHGHAAHVVSSLAALFLGSHDFIRAARYLSQSIAVLRASSLKQSELVLPRGKSHVELLWTLIVNIQNQAHMEAWVEAFKSLTPDEGEVVMKSKDAALGCCVMADRLMLVEMYRQPTQQKWNRVLTETLWLQQRAEQHGWGHLEAAARKTVVNIHGEFLKTPEACAATVRVYVGRDSVSPSDKGLVSGMLGKMLAGASHHREAMPWLRLSIESPDSGLPHDRMMTFLAAAKSVAGESEEEANRYSKAAAQMAKDSKDITDIEAA